MTEKFPRHELFGLTSQLRRASVSVPVNISEGVARHGSREFKHFLDISMGSLSELETSLMISEDLNYIKESELTQKLNDIKIITVQLKHLQAAILKRDS